MLDSEILEKLQGTSIEERIRVIEAILRSRLAGSANAFGFASLTLSLNQNMRSAPP